MRRSLVPVLRSGALSLVLCAASAASVFADVPVPPLERPVTDLTHTLTAGEVAGLESELAVFERSKGSQIAVLIVPTTAPETIEQYSIRVVEQWKLGRKGIDDGALLLVAKDDRALRIEVGYGLEGVLPDAVANRLIDERIVPRFRAGDFAGGIAAGVDAMIRIVEGEPLPAPPGRQPTPSDGDRIRFALLMAFVLAVVGGGILRAVFGRLVAASIVATVAGIVVWLLLASVLFTLLCVLVAFVLVLLGDTPRTGRRYRHGGAWGGGGFGGGFGGGWGGGGGGFGGGGASGRW